MFYKTVGLKGGRTATLDWLREDDLPEVVQALNSVIREGTYLFMNSEITDMEEEHRWFERAAKEGMRYLVARVDGRVVGGASMHVTLRSGLTLQSLAYTSAGATATWDWEQP